MTPAREPRVRYLVLAAATIAVGLVVHFFGLGLGTRGRDITGDALWAAMMFWLVSLGRPNLLPSFRGVIAFAICAAVETSQLYRSAGLDTLRETRLGHLALGSDFDARDFMAYAVGVLLAFLADRTQRAAQRRSV